MTRCPECGRVFLRRTLIETDYTCKFSDCDAFVPSMPEPYQDTSRHKYKPTVDPADDAPRADADADD